MTGRLPRRAVILALLAASVVVPARPAQAAGQTGACPDADGVTVVVDFQDLGGQTLVRCAPGPQSTGLAALKNAGFSVTGTSRWGEAFICRINGKPGAGSESCIDTPPASAYWSYWHAANGGSWTYSQLGVTGRTPPPGSFEGWSFALDSTATGAPPPGVTPRRAAPPDPPPADPPPADPPPGSGAGDGQAEDGVPPAAAPSTDRPPAGDPPPPSAPPTGPAGSPIASPTVADTGGPTSRPPSVPSDVDSAASQSGTGTPVGAAVGLGLLLALVIAAVVTARRRRASG